MILRNLNKAACFGLVLYALLAQSLYGHSDIKDTISEEIKFIRKLEDLFQGSAEFNNNTVKEKWQKSSSVVLCQAEMFVVPESEFVSSLGIVMPPHVNYYSRIKVKLQDKFAVQQYSEFTMNQNFYYEIQLIKSSGLQKTIDTKEAVTVTKGISGSITDYLSYIVIKNEYRKLAIPDLDTGDILDIRVATKLPTSILDKNGWAKLDKTLISPLYVRSMSSVNPVAKWSVHFHLNKEIAMNFVSYKSNSILDEISLSKKADYYFFTENDLEPTKPEFWSGEGLQKKGAKFVFFKTPNSNKTSSKLIQVNILEDLSDLCKTFYEYKPEYQLLFSQFLKANPKIANDEEWIEKFLLNYRMYVTMTGINNRESKYSFLGNVSRALQYQKIPFDYIYGVPDNLGGIDNIVSPLEGIFGIKIRETERLIFDLDLYDYKNEEFNVLNGREVFLIKPARNRFESYKITTTALPETNHSENVTSINLKLRFVDSVTVAAIEKETRVSGLNKLSVSNKRIPTSELHKQIKDYYLESNRSNRFKKRFYFENALISPAVYAEPNKKFITEETERMENMLLFFSKRHIEENCISDLESDNFDINKYSGFTLHSIGNTEEEPDLVFSEKYSVDNLIFPFQNGYVFSLGSLIGRQIEIKDTEDTIRTGDIFMNSPKTFEQVIQVEIPEGYSAAGIENFNAVVDNRTGGFTSKIEVKGNHLIWTSKKIYKGRFFSKNDWPLVLEFIKAANKAYQSKIILYK